VETGGVGKLFCESQVQVEVSVIVKELKYDFLGAVMFDLEPELVKTKKSLRNC